MIEEVWRRARASTALDRLIIATDDERISQAAAGFGAEVMLTSAAHASGTDRVAEVARRSGNDYPLVLNEGGDLTDIYRPIGLPTTWFIDRDGVIRFVFSGPMTKEALQVILEDVAAGREPDPFAALG